MTIILALLLSLFRFTGFFTEPRLSSEEIHAVNGERSRVVWPLADDRPLRIVTWNIERGIKFEAIAARLEDLDADVVLLQEVDRFCARSGQRDVARDLAVVLRMNWITGGEFQEIGAGGDRPCVSGQAILSRQPIDDERVMRFADQAALKWTINPAQPRRGGRMALRASTSGLVAYSVHLESGGNENLRARQVAQLAGDARSVDGAVLVGGDFNNEGDRDSRMFAPFQRAGFINTMAREAQHARRPIDWIFAKNLPGAAVAVLAPEASDHDPVVLVIPVQRRF